MIIFTKKKKLFVASLRRRLSLPTHKKLDKIRFGIHLAEHCNLNCAYCGHFSPIAEPELMPVDVFRRDFERMAELFNHECDLIWLYGGEPLLHPEIITLMEIARKNFTSGRIEILTNGILLAKQPPSFWEACRDNNIEIHVTHYNVDINIGRIRELVSQYGIAFNYSDYTCMDFFHMHINIAGNGNGRKSFDVCRDVNDCIMLEHGMLSTCPVTFCIRHFNKKFGVNIPVTPKDYIDIYKENDPDKILQRLTEEIPLCKYCNAIENTSAAWGRSKREISEWV